MCKRSEPVESGFGRGAHSPGGGQGVSKGLETAENLGH